MVVFGEAELDQIYRKYYRPLLGYFRTHVPCSEKEAEVLVQETWESVLKRYTEDPEKGGYNPAIAGFYTYIKSGFAYCIVLRERQKRMRRGLGDTWIEAAEAKKSLFAYLELLRLLFLCGGYPHQQLAFGYSKVIFGRQSDRGIEGNPARVDRECGDKPLAELAKSFFDDYIKESAIDDPCYLGLLKACARPLQERLSFSVEELLALDRASRERYIALHRCLVSRTCLRDYYASHKKGYVSAVPDWCFKVTAKLQACLDREGEANAKGGSPAGQKRFRVCGRCKLRHLSPCNLK